MVVLFCTGTTLQAPFSRNPRNIYIPVRQSLMLPRPSDYCRPSSNERVKGSRPYESGVEHVWSNTTACFCEPSQGAEEFNNPSCSKSRVDDASPPHISAHRVSPTVIVIFAFKTGRATTVALKPYRKSFFVISLISGGEKSM